MFKNNFFNDLGLVLHAPKRVQVNNKHVLNLVWSVWSRFQVYALFENNVEGINNQKFEGTIKE